MDRGGVVPGPFGTQVREKRGRGGVVHPVVGVRAANAVLGVLVRLLGRLWWTTHIAHRTPAGAALALALGCTVVAVPALVATPASAGDEETTFTVAMTNEVDSFNPFNGFEASSYEMWALTYDYLVNYSMKDMSPVPGLATGWDTSEDGLTWTFTVREGVQWSDGEDLTAADVAYTYNRIIDGGPEQGTWGSYLNSVTEVTAPDSTTVVLTLERPNAVLPLLPIPILPEHVWKDVAEKDVKSYRAEPTEDQPVVGSGPFRLVEGTAGGSTYVFEKNPDYWNGTPHVDRVAFRIFKSEDPAVQALIKGEVDFVDDISPLQVEALQGRDGIYAQNGVSPYFEEIGFNTGAVDPETGEPLGDGNPALKDPAFRRALGYAVDRDRLVQSAYQGAAVPGDTFIPTAYSRYRWEPPPDEAFTFDLEKAGQLLDEAGYTVGSAGLRTMPDGSPLGRLRLMARPEDQRSATIMEFFSEWLGDIGIESEVSVVESNRLTDVILEGNYDAFHWGWFVEPDPDAILDVFTCGQRGSYSDSWYCNPEYDALMKAQNSELDDDKRIAMIKTMQQMIFDDAPYLVTAYTQTGQAVRTDRFACFRPQPDPGGVLLVQYGSFNYNFLRPAAEAGDCDGVASAIGAATAAGGAGPGGDQGGNAGLLIGGGAVLLVLLAGGAIVATRRRASVGERE